MGVKQTLPEDIAKSAVTLLVVHAAVQQQQEAAYVNRAVMQRMEEPLQNQQRVLVAVQQRQAAEHVNRVVLPPNVQTDVLEQQQQVEIASHVLSFLINIVLRIRGVLKIALVLVYAVMDMIVSEIYLSLQILPSPLLLLVPRPLLDLEEVVHRKKQ